ncbi:MAG: S9 family peptidase [Thermoanaerobaculia bacterium]|nr:MAG: S9 family peptidase [Thermoanaerobaculia bacterium]MBZ0101177.1 S9 family peptidase [Thermoanaerobaculia bacterium]
MSRCRRFRAPFALHFVALAALSLPAAASAATAAQEAARPFDVQHLVTLERLSDPQPSPDGRTILFNLRSTDLEADRGRTDLWLVGSEGGGLRQLTTNEAGESNGRWAPVGRAVWYLSARGSSSQVWKLPLDGGEPIRVTDLPLDVAGFELSPDGKYLVLALELFPDCETIACTAERLADEASRKFSARVYEQLPIRHWDTWRDGRRNHLVALPVAGGEPVDLMRGMDADCPSRPFGGLEEMTFTPDGKGVVFAAKVAGREEAWTTNFDLWSVPLDGSAAPTPLVTRPAWDTRPVFSPDGRTLAYLSMERPGFEADRFRIVLRNQQSGVERVLTEQWDRSANEIVWSRDGRTIWTTAQDLGQVALFGIDVASGRVRRIVSKGSNHSPALVRGGRIVYSKDTLRAPADLWSVLPDGSGEMRLTRLNEAAMATAKLGEAEQFDFVGAGGDKVYGYLVKPVDFDPAKTYPLAFLVHGGPQGSMANSFHYRWNPQTYAGAGYAAVMIDFHGSTGYGQAFTDAITGDWGGKPLEDLQKGLAAVLERYPWIDGERACALGASYGGYMINWIAGAWPDRFDCLVSHDGNLDERFAYFATEELWFPEWEHGLPWENPEAYAKHNPVDLVDRWQTPILVIHGAKDFRVVDTAGMATFTAAQRRGIPSKFVYFPDENHWVLRPHNSIFWHETVLDWLARWTAPAN